MLVNFEDKNYVRLESTDKNVGRYHFLEMSMVRKLKKNRSATETASEAKFLFRGAKLVKVVIFIQIGVRLSELCKSKIFGYRMVSKKWVKKNIFQFD